MPSPFEDGGQTKTIDIPEIEPEPERQQQSSSLAWMVIGAVTLILLALLVVAVVALSG